MQFSSFKPALVFLAASDLVRGDVEIVPHISTTQAKIHYSFSGEAEESEAGPQHPAASSTGVWLQYCSSTDGEKQVMREGLHKGPADRTHKVLLFVLLFKCVLSKYVRKYF